MPWDLRRDREPPVPDGIRGSNTHHQAGVFFAFVHHASSFPLRERWKTPEIKRPAGHQTRYFTHTLWRRAITICPMRTSQVPLEESAKRWPGRTCVEENPRASQRRSRLGGLSGEELDSLVSSPNPVAASRVVPQQGDATGEKTDRSADVSATTAVDRQASQRADEDESDCFTLSSKHALAYSGTNKHALTAIVRVTSYRR